MTQFLGNLNWVDYTIFAIVCLSTIFSLFRGFVREAISLLAWVGGFFIALKFSLPAQVHLQPWISQEGVRYFICFVLIFLSVVIVGMLINVFVGFLIKSTGLSFFDRFVGIVFGIVRGLAIVAVLLLLLINIGMMHESQALQQSVLANKFKPVVRWLDSFLPEKIKRMTVWVTDEYHEQKTS